MIFSFTKSKLVYSFESLSLKSMQGHGALYLTIKFEMDDVGGLYDFNGKDQKGEGKDDFKKIIADTLKCFASIQTSIFSNISLS